MCKRGWQRGGMVLQEGREPGGTGGTATSKIPARRSPMQVGSTSRTSLGKPSSRPRHVGHSFSSGFGWPPSATCQGPGGRARSSHPCWAFSSCPPRCSSASSAQLITVPRELIWGFLICRGSHRGLPSFFLGSPSTEHFFTQVSSTGPGYPESHGHDWEIRLSDLTGVTEKCCVRGRELRDEIPVEGQRWEMKS